MKKPIVCLCRYEHLIGMTLREDYDQSSRDYWAAVERGDISYDATVSGSDREILIKIPRHKLFVLDANQEAWSKLIDDSPVERATFKMPRLLPEQNLELKNAGYYFKGIIPDPVCGDKVWDYLNEGGCVQVTPNGSNPKKFEKRYAEYYLEASKQKQITFFSPATYERNLKKLLDGGPVPEEIVFSRGERFSELNLNPLLYATSDHTLVYKYFPEMGK